MRVKRIVIWSAHVSPLVPLSCRLPRAPHLLHSLFLLSRHQNTQHNRDNTIYSKNTQHIINLSRLSQSTSSAIKNHSGVKTCRVAETRARQLAQGKPRCGKFAWTLEKHRTPNALVDSDWAGDPRTRCSSSGEVITLGRFTLQLSCVTRARISLISAEAEN